VRYLRISQFACLFVLIIGQAWLIHRVAVREIPTYCESMDGQPTSFINAAGDPNHAE
jgi:hypothetical protein